MTRKRFKTRYPGVYEEPLSNGDVSYYVLYRDDEGKQVCALHGRKSRNKTAKTASVWRGNLMQGKVQTRQQKRDEKRQKQARDIMHLYEDHYLKNKGKSGREDSLFELRVKPHWAGRDIEAATNEDMANFRVWLEKQTTRQGRPLAPQTVKHGIGLFRRIVRHAKRHIKGFSLLIDDFAVPSVNNEKTEDLTKDQLEALLGVLEADTVTAIGKKGKPYLCKINRPVADMLLLIMNTGMRRGEAIKLQWQHVNFDRKTILLKEPKGGKDVTIPMGPGARAVLKRQRKRSMYVFPGANGGKRLHIDVQARKIRDLAGLPKDWRPCHGLRHFFATELIDEGVHPKVVSELLGHKDLGVSNRYLSAREDKKVAAVELINFGGTV